MKGWKFFIGIAAICAVGALSTPKFGLPPPELFKWLPEDAKARLKEIHEDHSLKWEERRKMIDGVFDSLPADVLEKMPLPPGLDKLPQDVQDKLKAIHTDKSIKWGQKREKMHEIIQSLPEEQRKLLPPPRFGGPSPFGPRGLPPRPPKQFKEVLPSEVYQKLVEIHQNKNFTEEEKKNKIDETLKALPKETLTKLPLPPNFDKLPAESQQKAREILSDFSKDFDTRHRNLRQFIESLPEEQRKLLPPPPFGAPPPFGHHGFPPFPPRGFEDVLTTEVYQKLVEIHQNKNLTEAEKKAQIDETMKNVPKETLIKLPLPPNFDKLPSESQQKAREILSDFSKDFDTRQKNLRKFIESLTDEQQKLLRPHWGGFGPFGPHHHHGFLPHPPKEFKEILGEEIYNKLDAVHQLNVTREERFKKLDEIMSKIPKETLDKLPLPPPFRQLPDDVQTKIHEIMRDFSIDGSKRFKKVREFIKTLPEEQQRLVPPPPPFH